MVDVLNPSVKLGNQAKMMLGGKHLGKLPIIGVGLIVAVLVFAVGFGINKRMNVGQDQSADVSADSPAAVPLAKEVDGDAKQVVFNLTDPSLTQSQSDGGPGGSLSAGSQYGRDLGPLDSVLGAVGFGSGVPEVPEEPVEPDVEESLVIDLTPDPSVDEAAIADQLLNQDVLANDVYADKEVIEAVKEFERNSIIDQMQARHNGVLSSASLDVGLSNRGLGSSAVGRGNDSGVPDPRAPVDLSDLEGPQGGGAVAGLGQGLPQGLPPGYTEGAGENMDPNRQSQKREFSGVTPPPGSGSEDTSGLLGTLPARQLWPYELKVGSVIPALLLTDLNSDLPGMLLGQVSSNVYDTATGDELLIPQGSRLIGEYDSQVTYGQKRTLVVWRRIIFPDGTNLNLSTMPGVDKRGRAGLMGEVDNHYFKIFGSILLVSLFEVIPFYLADKADVGDQYSSAASGNGDVQGSVGQGVAEAGTEITRRNLGIQPTLTVEQGTRFNVLVNQDIRFHGAYN